MRAIANKIMFSLKGCLVVNIFVYLMDINLLYSPLPINAIGNHLFQVCETTELYNE